MKKNELIKIIRVVVKEEVQKSLKKELTEVFKSLRTKPLVKETKRVVKKRKPMKLAKDPVLNQILNETRGGVPQGEEEYPTMGGKTFDRNSMASLMGYGNVGGEEQNISNTTVGHSGAQVQDEQLAGILNRDYSDVMKAMDKKQKEKGGVK